MNGLLVDTIRSATRLAAHQRLLSAVILFVFTLACRSVAAQQVQLSTPQFGASDSFHERFGTSWGFRSGNAFFNFGGPNPGLPPFGGHDPNADARFGLGGRWGGGAFSLQGFAGQGSSRTLVADTPMIVIPNGGVGTVANTLQRPFVTGLAPVVGRRSISPLLERLERLRQQRSALGHAASRSALPGNAVELPADANSVDRLSTRDALPGGGGADSADGSTASRGDLSVAEIRRRQAEREEVERQRELTEVRQLIERGRGCEEAGKLGAAAIYYKQAARRAESPLREQLLDHARQLGR